MQIEITESDEQLPVDRAYVLSMVIKSFKGRRNVEVHLFRPTWDPAEVKQYDWEELIGPVFDMSLPPDPEGSKKVLLESFTMEERDQIIGFLQQQYATKLEAIRSQPLSFPVPMGLTPLSEVKETKSVGFLLFDKIPSYKLGIPLRGIFDLSEHEPIVEPQD